MRFITSAWYVGRQARRIASNIGKLPELLRADNKKGSANQRPTLPNLIIKTLQLLKVLVTAFPPVTRFPPWNRRSPVLRERGFSHARNLHRPTFSQTKFKRGLVRSLFWREA